MLRGLYRGEAVTILREAQAYGVWFLAFEYLMNQEARYVPREDIPSWKIALYGGLAGEALWLSSYPLDVSSIIALQPLIICAKWGISCIMNKRLTRLCLLRL